MRFTNKPLLPPTGRSSAGALHLRHRLADRRALERQRAGAVQGGEQRVQERPGDAQRMGAEPP